MRPYMKEKLPEWFRKHISVLFLNTQNPTKYLVK